MRRVQQRGEFELSRVFTTGSYGRPSPTLEPWATRTGDFDKVNAVMADVDELEQTARAFLRVAWDALARQHVVPPPRFHPNIKVGRDYFGDAVHGLLEYKQLEELITACHPRFSDEAALGERDFAAPYIFSLLEAFVARSAQSHGRLDTRGDAAAESIRDLETALHASSWEVACCRVVSHLGTADAGEVEIAGIKVTPLGEHGSMSRDAAEVIGAVIKGAGMAYAREMPFVYAPPESVLTVRCVDPNPFDAAEVLSGRIERFLLAVRLLCAGTTESVFEVQGETALVRRFKPTLVRFRGAGPDLLSPTARVRRSVRISAADAVRVDGILAALEFARHPRDGMAVTSFGMALQKFQLSFHAHTWYEQVVDLATALEAALSGSDTTDVLLRLKTRAAALLASDQDPAAAIFADIGSLYSLRSRLVHGGELTEKQLKKQITTVSTVPSDALPGTATGYAVDRLRDLVRRSLLARICLAADGDDSLWPLAQDRGVDAALADDETRVLWRSRWRHRLASFEAECAADPPRAAVNAISQDDI